MNKFVVTNIKIEPPMEITYFSFDTEKGVFVDAHCRILEEAIISQNPPTVFWEEQLFEEDDIMLFVKSLYPGEDKNTFFNLSLTSEKEPISNTKIEQINFPKFTTPIGSFEFDCNDRIKSRVNYYKNGKNVYAVMSFLSKTNINVGWVSIDSCMGDWSILVFSPEAKETDFYSDETLFRTDYDYIIDLLRYKCPIDICRDNFHTEFVARDYGFIDR